MIDDFLKGLIQVPAANQMFVVAIVCIVGFGWVFVKVLNNQTTVLNAQTAILGNIQTLIQSQITAENTKSAQMDRVSDSVNTLSKELALHRIISEAKDICNFSGKGA